MIRSFHLPPAWFAYAGWHETWEPLLQNIATLLGALLLAWLIHLALYTFFRHLSTRHNLPLAHTIARRTSGPVRVLLLLVAVSLVYPQWSVPPSLTLLVPHLLEIGYIAVLAWLSVGLLDIFNAFIRSRLPEDLELNVRARRTRTQIHLLRQILAGLIIFGAFAAILMTFPTIRSIGAGLLASAGLAGLALGMAARPTLGNLIAGIQVALTEPIRIDDAVVVEGEWGRVAEVNTTYVVIRLWDLRHLIVPLSYFIEKPFQNWTRYSSELTGAVTIYADYTVPVEELREAHAAILRSSPLWNGKIRTVQVTGATEHSVEIRFLMSADSPTTTFDLRCYVREKLIEYLQNNYPGALPHARADVTFFERRK